MLLATVAALLTASYAAAQSTSEVVAVMLIGREGDRTPEVIGNTQLTTLGQNQVFNTGSFFHNYYLNSSSPNFIQGVVPAYYYRQIYAAAPNENVLGNTATAFLQGLYPPDQPVTAGELNNGSVQFSPVGGYQYAFVNGIPATAPDTIWIEGDQYCPTMTNASQTYYQSLDFITQLAELQPFYDRFEPLLAGIFPDNEIGFQNAYEIFDYLNVGYIHNRTIFGNMFTADLYQLKCLADRQELALVYNWTEPNSSIGGQTLSASILAQLTKTVSGSDPDLKITYFAAPYSVMQAFFGISGLLEASSNFYGLPEYASTMSFELRRPSGATDMSNAFVRFGFRNGSLPTASLNTFPLFGRTQIEADIPWAQFVSGMTGQSIPTQQMWCEMCSSPLSFCAAYTNFVGRISAPLSKGKLSLKAAGGIGAGVAIAAILAIEGGIALVWLAKKKRSNTLQGEKPWSDTASDRALVA